MNSDIVRTQFFTTNYKKILNGLKIPQGKVYVDPFAGNCDLKEVCSTKSWLFYDIDPKKENVIQNDSLLNPIDYTGKIVITNPPWLAKNKTKQFQDVFEKYAVDDLYKCSILSILGCDGGILIIPTNFWMDERSAKVRKLFLSKYRVEKVNVFDEQVFEDTPYTTCSFSFTKSDLELTEQTITFNNITLTLKKDLNWRVGGEFYKKYETIKSFFTRLKLKDVPTQTNIFLYGVDTREQKLHLEYRSIPYYGKVSDRGFATLVSKKVITAETQQQIIAIFNRYINFVRYLYNDMILTIFRDHGRKRIPLDLAYAICTEIYNRLKE